MRRLALSLIVTLGLCAAVAPNAFAGSDGWTCSLDPADSCAGPYHTLTGAAAVDNGGGSRRVCAAAKFSNGLFNGSYFCALYLACHTYGAGHQLYPMIRNGTNATTPTTFSIRGLSTWGSTPAADYCPAGTASRAAPSTEPVDAGDDLETFASNSQRNIEPPSAGVALQTRTGADAKAHSFSTPHGTAWLVSSDTDDRVCLAIPDVDGFGVTCVTHKQAGEGLLNGELVSPSEDDPTSIFAAALPSGAEATLTRNNGERVPLTVSRGVATGVVSGPATLRVSGPDVDQTVTLNADGASKH